MDTSETLLIYTEPTIGVPFGLAICLGLTAIAGAVLLRPWPPRSSRGLMFAGVLAVCVTAAYLIARHREVHIDVARQQVSESVEAFGIGHSRSWPFAEVRAVVVERGRERAQSSGPRPDPGAVMRSWFGVYLIAGDERLELRRHDVVLDAEAEAARVAVAAGWPALRRGYRLELSLPGGQTEAFELADGRRGLSVDLQKLLRVVEAPSEESAIGKRPWS